MASLEIPGITESDSDSSCPTLTFTQRMIGFGITCAISVVLAIVAWVAVFQENWTLFGVCITISNLMALGGSLFLAGPKKQAKKMMEERRWIFSVIYLLSMALTLVAALAIKSGALTIVCCVIQYIALAFYALSYIPGGQWMAKKLVGL